jgi:hypothetical protein
MDLPVDPVRIYRTAELRSFDTDQLLSVLSDTATEKARGLLVAKADNYPGWQRKSLCLRRQIARIRTLFTERAKAVGSSSLSRCELRMLADSIPDLRSLSNQSLQRVPRSIRLLWSFVYGTLMCSGVLATGANAGANKSVGGLDLHELQRVLEGSADIAHYRHSLAGISPFDSIGVCDNSARFNYIFEKDMPYRGEPAPEYERSGRINPALLVEYVAEAAGGKRNQISGKDSSEGEWAFRQALNARLADMGLMKSREDSVVRHACLQFRDEEFGICRRGAWSRASWLFLKLPRNFFAMEIDGLSSVQLLSSEVTVPPRLASFVCDSGQVAICARVTKVSSHPKADLLLRIFLNNGDWAQHNFSFV